MKSVYEIAVDYFTKRCYDFYLLEKLCKKYTLLVIAILYVAKSHELAKRRSKVLQIKRMLEFLYGYWSLEIENEK